MRNVSASLLLLLLLRVALTNVIFIIIYMHYVIWSLIDWLALWVRYK